MNNSVEVPRLNANEDQLQIVDIRVANGDSVAVGDILFVAETTKAASEINAPTDGVVRGIRINVGDFVSVGSVLCELSSPDSATGPAAASNPVPEPAEFSITAKARKLALSMGIDPTTILTASGRVTEADVRAAARNSERNLGLEGPSIPMTSRSGKRRAVVIGGGGHAACIIDALEGSGYELVGCTDSRLPVGEKVYRGVTVIGTEERLASLRSSDVDFAFIGIGGATSSVLRYEKFRLARSLGFILPPAIHRSAMVAPDVTIGDGCHILAGATIGPRCAIAENVIVNQGAIVCHDSEILDHAHIAPGAILAGGVSVGPMTVVGMGVTVLLRVKIGGNCLIYNGAHIVSDVADDIVVDTTGHRKLRPPPT